MSDPEGARNQPPILPYRGHDGHERPLLPAAVSVYRTFGIVSLTTAGAAWFLIGGGWYSEGMGYYDMRAFGCCSGVLTWIVSTTLAATVMARDRHLGRRFALLAFLLDMLLLVVVLGLWNAR